MSCGKGMSGSKFGNSLVNETPVYDKKRMFRKKLGMGRPKKGTKQLWVK